MYEEKSDIHSKCWNKYKELHTDKIIYINKIYEIFNNLAIILKEFDTKYKTLEIEKFINPIINNKINETIKMINKSIISFININQTMTKNIVNSFKDIRKLIKNENENNIYEQLILYSMEYDEEKKKLIQSKAFIYSKLRLLEESVTSEIIDKKEIKIDKKDMENALNEFNNYKIYVNEVNKKRINFNKTQTELLKIYQKVILEKESELYQKLNINFYTAQKTENDLTLVNMEKIKDKKKSIKKIIIKKYYHFIIVRISLMKKLKYLVII